MHKDTNTEWFGWYFDQVYRSSNVFDYGVQDLRSVADAGRYHTSVVVRRYGEAIFPVDVLVTFKGGELTVAQFLDWVQMMPQRNGSVLQQIPGAPDSVLKSRLERYYRSLIILTFGGGVNEVQRDLIAVFGLDMPMAKR